MLRKILIAIVVLFACAILIVVIVFQMTGGVVEVAETFFSEIRAGNFDQAYETYLSEEFKNNTSQTNLKTFIAKSNLSDYHEASWNTRSIKNKRGELEGTITTSSGTAVPLSLLLIKEQNQWKILSITIPQAGLDVVSAKPDIPETGILKLLVAESVHDLALAINARDFTPLYNSISRFWKNQTTAEELKQGFAAFINQKIDLTAVKGVEPVFDKVPIINEQDVLELAGYFPTKPAMVYFKLGYTYEHPDWKLVGIDINVK